MAIQGEVSSYSGGMRWYNFDFAADSNTGLDNPDFKWSSRGTKPIAAQISIQQNKYI